MRYFLTLLLICGLAISSFSQINFGKLKDRVKKVVEEEKVEPAALTNSDDRMADFRKDQLKKDTSFYNYIFSQGNRSSFFAKELYFISKRP